MAAPVRRNRPIFLTVDELFYSPAQISKLRVLINHFSAAGLSGVVVSSLEMIFWLRERLPHLKITASTTAHVLNSESANFHKPFGVDRITAPVSVTLREIMEIRKLCPDMEFECFILNESCININGLCLYFHGTESDFLGTGTAPAGIPASTRRSKIRNDLT